MVRYDPKESISPIKSYIYNTVINFRYNTELLPFHFRNRDVIKFCLLFSSLTNGESVYRHRHYLPVTTSFVEVPH